MHGLTEDYPLHFACSSAFTFSTLGTNRCADLGLHMQTINAQDIKIVSRIRFIK